MDLTIRNILLNFKDKFNRIQNNKTFSDELNTYLNSEDVLTEDYKMKIKSYWNKYKKIDTNYHNLYISRSGIKDTKYIPKNVYFNDIIPFYNNNELSKAFSDKSYTSLFFKKIKRPITIAKNINGIIYNDDFKMLTFDELLNEISINKEVIIKPSINSGAGRGITFLNIDEKKIMKEEIEKHLQKFGNNFVVQKIIKQHKVLKSLNPSSVNTIRVMSFLNKNGVNILSSHVRIGTNNNKVDHNGIVCGISSSGVTKDFAIGYDNREILFEHPQGHNFKEIKIPGFDKIAEVVKNEHLKLGHFRIISWDFSIDEQGNPVLIEINLRSPGIDNHQLTSGPLFGDLTDGVLNEVFPKKREGKI